MRLLAVSAAACTLWVLAWPSTAFAEATLTVLGLRSATADEAQARNLTNALRRAADQSGTDELVHSRRRNDLSQLLIVFDCDEPTSSCMQEIGRTMESDWLIYGILEPQSGHGRRSYLVTLRYFNVRTGTVERSLRESLSRALPPAELLSTGRRFFAALTGYGVGSVTVDANVVGAQVFIDGERAGSTGEEPLVVPDLPAGEVTVAVRHGDYLPFEETVTVRAGGSVNVAALLEERSPGGGEPGGTGDVDGGPDIDYQTGSARQRGSGLVWLGWSAIGLAAVAGGLGLASSLVVESVNNEPAWVDELRGWTTKEDVCEGVRESGAKVSSTDEIIRLCNKGQRWAVVQWVMYGVAAAAFGVGLGVLLHERRRRQREQPRAWQLNLNAPMVWDGGGYWSAQLVF
jgi:hypothetical protein